MSIVVTAATGRVGSRVVRLLVQAGVRPTLLLRDPTRLDPDLRDLVEVRPGDLTDPGHVREATAGARALFWLDTTDHAAADPVAASAEQGRIVADAVRANGIDRTVFLSSVGAERRRGVGHIDGLPCPPPARRTRRWPGSTRATSARWPPPGCCPPRGPGGRCTAVTTTPTTLGEWAYAHLRPLLA